MKTKRWMFYDADSGTFEELTDEEKTQKMKQYMICFPEMNDPNKRRCLRNVTGTKYLWVKG